MTIFRTDPPHESQQLAHLERGTLPGPKANRPAGRARPVLRLLTVLVGTAAAAVSVVFIANHRQQLPQVAAALARAQRGYVALAAIAMLLGFLNHAALHAACRRAIGLRCSTRQTLPTSMRAGFANKVAKTGGLAAFGVFVADARRQRLSSGATITAYALATLLARLGFIVTLATMYTLGASVAPPIRLSPAVVIVFIVAAVAVACTALALWARNRLPRPSPNANPQGAANEFAHSDARAARRAALTRPIRHACQQLRHHPVVLARALLHALAVELIGATMLWAALQAVGAPLPIASLSAIYATTTLVGAVGILPSGLGVIEVTLAAGLLHAGVPPITTTSAIALYRLFQLWLPLAIGAGLVASLANRNRGHGDTRLAAAGRAQALRHARDGDRVAASAPSGGWPGLGAPALTSQ